MRSFSNFVRHTAKLLRIRIGTSGILFVGCAAILALSPISIGHLPEIHADTATTTLALTDASDTEAQINQSNAQIAQLKQEIAQLQTQLTATSKQKQTLQSAITETNLNIKKITTSITLTNAQITQKDIEIKKINGNISTTTSETNQVQYEVGASLQALAAQDDEPLALSLFTGETLSQLFDDAASLDSLRIGLEQKITELTSLKTTLQTSKTTAQQKRADLASLQQQLSQQKQGLAIARDTQTQLLAVTKNQESNYQALITQKQAQEAKFEQDLLTYQSNLGLKVTAGSLPPSGSQPLQWPLDSIRITQYFGNTPFATQNPQIYNGHGHSGVDFAASPGTPVKAARSGIVLGTGNTDLTCPNASYGKWIFIKHDDGLSTIYAHLSVIGVTQGQQVTTGQVIGYSDTTGYATGPHLHFGVFASSGSEISSFASQGCKGKTYTMPVGDLSAYLNPLSYLPPAQ